MSNPAITKANEVINAKTGYVGGGMEGYAVLAFNDESGYPAMSTKTIACADGINWLTFNTSPDANAVRRINQNNYGSVCISSSEYHISLMGTFEVLTDTVTKKDNWFEPMGHMWSGPEDPDFCVLRFTTESYNIFIAESDESATGTLKTAESKPKLTVTPTLGFTGQSAQAIELYEKALGAVVVEKVFFSDADPKDFICKEDEKDHIFFGQMAIGSQIINFGDDSEDSLGNDSDMALLVTFETPDDVKAAYEILSEGATILTPICSTTYCTCYSHLIDKFGIHWQLISE